ncbi:MAG: outer membrane protein assembly factor BamA [Deltaproteobacteria bacterium]|nr:MAG: outer membrane protein assembly factor BamA [Deltaproteobacteria bacterium]
MERPRLPPSGVRTLIAALCALGAGPTAPGSALAAPPTVVLQGKLLDDPAQLRRLLRFDGTRSADEVEAAVATLLRCDEGIVATVGRDDRYRERRLLDELGYCVTKVARGAGRLTIHLDRYAVVHKVYVRGNWPLFEEQVLRRLRFRPGQRIPQPGKDRDAAVEREKRRVLRYLGREGYPRGRVTIRFERPDSAGRVKVRVRLYKGSSYKVGEVRIVEMARAAAGTKPKALDPAVPRKEIVKLFQSRILFYKRAFSTERFKKNIEELIKRYHKRGYPGVRVKGSYEVDPKRPSSSAVRITLRIQERKRIIVRYVGNSSLSKSDLREGLTIFEAGAYDDYEIAQSAKQIAKLYQGKGYLQAQVRFSRKVVQTKGKPDFDRVTFQIQEGPRFRVERVMFSGNARIPQDKLRAKIRTAVYPWLGLGSAGYVTPRQLEQDAERVANYYRARGFPKVKVRADLAPHPQLLGKPAALAAAIGSGKAQDGKLYVRFRIEEGPQLKVERLEIDGARAISKETLRRGLELGPNRPFTPAGLAADKVRIVRSYAGAGHPYATVRSLESFDEDTKTKVDVQLAIDEGKEVRFGPVFMRGNSVTRAFVIRNALAFKPGDRFDIRKLERSEKNLRGLGIFNSVRIQLLDVKSRSETVSVLVRVEERYDDYGTIGLGVGGSTDNLVFGSLSYAWRNVGGIGLSVEARGEFGPQIQSSGLNLFYPRFLGSEFSSDLRFFLRNEVTERLGDIFTYGATLTFSRQLLKHLRGFVRYEIRQIESKEPLNRPLGSVNEDRTRPVTTRTGAFSAALIYDRRDNPLAPTKGFQLQAQVRYASEYLGGTSDFLALRTYGNAYIPLPFGIIIAMGVRYDHGFPLRGAVLLPKVERFFAGGDTTIRGFEEDRAFAERVEGPLSPLGGTSFVKLVPQGGNIRLLTNLELQVPIWKDSPLGLPLLGAVFVDNGLVTNSFQRLKSDDFRHGIGVALRIFTMVGFLSLEYAWPLDPDVGDPREGRFHFNFGFVF